MIILEKYFPISRILFIVSVLSKYLIENIFSLRFQNFLQTLQGTLFDSVKEFIVIISPGSREGLT